eukprot:TRINITY_DN16214_c0_g1_i1.p1 TRINITY_DN16214_c0_g1~~TRINITY_DN16214_c0_g1_i1.p1  ORF type:complete len:122 (-),score=9.79 TRINITY_DN16214_c0_g1_i1:261-626(-)
MEAYICACPSGNGNYLIGSNNTTPYQSLNLYSVPLSIMEGISYHCAKRQKTGNQYILSWITATLSHPLLKLFENLKATIESESKSMATCFYLLADMQEIFGCINPHKNKKKCLERKVCTSE